MNENITKLKIIGCVAIMIPLWVFLIYESAHYMTFQRLPLWLGYIMAATLEGAAVFFAVQRGLFRFVMLSGIVIFVLYATSMNRISVSEAETAEQRNTRAQLVALDSQIEALNTDISWLQEKGQKANAALNMRKRNSLIEKRNELADSVGSDPVSQVIRWGHIGIGIIVLRLIAEITNMWLAASAWGLLRDLLDIREHTPDDPLSEDEKKTLEFLNEKNGGHRVPWELLRTSGRLKGARTADYRRIVQSLHEKGVVHYSRNGSAKNDTITVLK